MEVSPKTLREVEFREKMRGYHPEDVDQFLEQVAAGIEVLQDRLRQAVERAQRAEAAASDSGGADETLKKTLVLAQRTADMAVQEAREQAARILASAEQQAQAILAEAEDRGRRTLDEAIAESKAELARLEAGRSQAEQDVETLQRWLEEHKDHLKATLTEALSAVERAGVLWPAPPTRSLERGARRAAVPASAEYESANGAGYDTGPDTMLWSPSDEEEAAAAAPVAAAPAPAQPQPPAPLQAPAQAAAAAPLHEDLEPGLAEDQQAMDDFFDDDSGLEEEPRFGGRLRRRR